MNELTEEQQAKAANWYVFCQDYYKKYKNIKKKYYQRVGIRRYERK